jgi:hypothetical protein
LPIDRRKFVHLSASALLGASYARANPLATNAAKPPCMLKPTDEAGFTSRVLMTTGDSITEYRPPGIMDGMGAWDWNDSTVRLFVNHELPPHDGYIWKLANGTELRGARISWFDIDKQSRQITAAGNAITEIRDRRSEVVTRPEQIHEHWDKESLKGLNTLCSAQGYQAGSFGFGDDILFTHEEVSGREDHPHGGSVWALDTHTGTLWALPELGRGSWENVTAVETPDQNKDDGHIALLMGDDLEFGGAPLYLWLGRKDPQGDFPDRNGLTHGQLYAWASDEGDASPQDWNGTGSTRAGHFVPIRTRNKNQAGQQKHDRDGYLDDSALRDSARRSGAFMFSRPEDLHTNPADHSQVVLCSTGHGRMFPADDWGTVYKINVAIGAQKNNLGNKQEKNRATKFTPTARIEILHDCDDFGDHGIRSADNVCWASDGMIYIHEDKATKRNRFGGSTERESSTWRINPEDPDDREVVAIIDRSVVLPTGAQDGQKRSLGAWECCGLIDVSALFTTLPNELLMITAVQAHSVRGGPLGDHKGLVQGGQLVMLSRLPTKA